MAPILRVNSVAVSTARFAAVGMRLLQDDFVKMLVDYGYEPEQIVGIQYLPHRQIVIVKFKTTEQYSKFLELDSVKINNVPCRLYDMSSKYTQVTVLGAPFEMDKTDITAILAQYGQVHSIRPRLLACSSNKHFNSIPDGTWLANMEVKEPIPSYINVTDFQLAIYYFGQPKTCRRCGSTDHLARDCNQRELTDAAIDPRAFPSLEEAHTRSSANVTQHCQPEGPDAAAAEPPNSGSAGTQDLSTTEENQHIECINSNGSTQDTADKMTDTPDTRDAVPPNNRVPTPTFKVRAASEKDQRPNANTSHIEKNQKGKTKPKKPPISTGPATSTTDLNPKMQLRPIKKRQQTTGKSDLPAKDSEKDLNTPTTCPEQIIDLDKNYLVQVNFHEQIVNVT